MHGKVKQYGFYINLGKLLVASFEVRLICARSLLISPTFPFVTFFVSFLNSIPFVSFFSMGDFDPFADLEKQEDTYARPRKCDTMKRGQLYEVIAFKKQLSKFQKDNINQTFNTVVQYKEHGMKFSSILPTKYNNKADKWFDAMNKLIAEKKPPSVVFYGTIGMGHEVDILRHGQGWYLVLGQIKRNTDCRCKI
jgi:hypothetical protein